MSRTLPISFYLFLLGGLLVANENIYRALLSPHVLKVSVLEVGKGNATFLRSPRGETLLINTGPDASILRALGNTLPEWKRDINAVILTNSSLRTAGGLPEIFGRYHVGTLIRFGTVGSKSFEAALSAAESAAKGLQQTTISYGTRLIFDADTHIVIVSSTEFTISYGATLLTISSTTPKKTYVFK